MIGFTSLKIKGGSRISGASQTTGPRARKSGVSLLGTSALNLPFLIMKINFQFPEGS